MDCHKADELMMKYMDNIISEAEAKLLNEHFESCAGCKTDFMLYDKILNDFQLFTESDIICAPENFEEMVMAKIKELPSISASVSNAVETMMCAVWGTLSVLLGVGFLAAINRAAIMEYFYSRPEYSAFAGLLGAVSDYTTRFSNNLIFVTGQVVSMAGNFIEQSRYVFLGIFGILMVIQLILLRRGKAEV